MGNSCLIVAVCSYRDGAGLCVVTECGDITTVHEGLAVDKHSSDVVKIDEHILFPETAKNMKEALAYLETLANFGGTIQQARELAQKGLDKIKGVDKFKDDNV